MLEKNNLMLENTYLMLEKKHQMLENITCSNAVARKEQSNAKKHLFNAGKEASNARKHIFNAGKDPSNDLMLIEIYLMLENI